MNVLFYVMCLCDAALALLARALERCRLAVKLVQTVQLQEQAIQLSSV